MRMIKKQRPLSLCSVLLLAVFFAFAPHVMGAPAWKWPNELSIGTPAVGSGSHAQTVAWAAIMDKITGMKVRVIPEASEGSLVRRSLAGDLTINYSSIGATSLYLEGVEGSVSFPKGEIRLVWHGMDTPWLYACMGDSELKNIYDIKKFAESGKKVRIATVKSHTSIVLYLEKALPAFLGILGKEEVMKNIVFVPISTYPANVKSIAEGKTDVAFVSPITSVTQEIEVHPKGIRWLEVPAADKKGWAEFLKWQPNALPSRIPMGVKSAIGKEGFVSNYAYMMRAQGDAELAYHLAKWLHQNFGAYKDSHLLNSRMSIELFREYLNYCPLPVHDGVVRYLREIGQWAAADDAWNQEAKKLVGRYIEAWKVATAQAAQKKIKVVYDSKEWVDLWKSTVQDIPPFKVRLK